MKYMISWFERPQGSPMEYENAQKRILEVFTQWKAPGANSEKRFSISKVLPTPVCLNLSGNAVLAPPSKGRLTSCTVPGSTPTVWQ
jgi:hypothetical protein